MSAERTYVVLEEDGKVRVVLKEGSVVAADLPVATRKGAESIAESWVSGSIEHLAD